MYNYYSELKKIKEKEEEIKLKQNQKFYNIKYKSKYYFNIN